MLIRDNTDGKFYKLPLSIILDGNEKFDSSCKTIGGTYKGYYEVVSPENIEDSVFLSAVYDIIKNSQVIFIHSNLNLKKSFTSTRKNEINELLSSFGKFDFHNNYFYEIFFEYFKDILLDEKKDEIITKLGWDNKVIIIDYHDGREIVMAKQNESFISQIDVFIEEALLRLKKKESGENNVGTFMA